ncbi:hypothetical protein ACFP51_09650 [Streptomyces pratens]|uniref:DUF397 domain-containing protein n=1 Tax=Streptomyces pratens TaxID=887456 RepID=A0ABW1LXW9_9ACTN
MGGDEAAAVFRLPHEEPGEPELFALKRRAPDTSRHGTPAGNTNGWTAGNTPGSTAGSTDGSTDGWTDFGSGV